ncbi:MAG: hypothetical protein AAFX93_20445 [Verrucomicrobiota bacterium]
MGFLLVIFIITILKFDQDRLGAAIKEVNLAIVFATLLFVVVGLIHLFSPQPWTPDILKVVIGVIVGAASAGGAKSLVDAAKSVEAAGATFGDNAKLAAGDINEISQKIENLKGDVSSIKNSVIKQYPKIDSALNTLESEKFKVKEVLFTPVYFRESEPIQEIVLISRRLEAEGWNLKYASNGFGDATVDAGILLLFERHRNPNDNDIKLADGTFMSRYFHGLDAIELT